MAVTDQDIPEADLPCELAEPPSVEALVMDTLGIGRVERAILGVQVHRRDLPTRAEQPIYARQGRAGVLDVMQQEERDHEVERRAGRRRVCREVEMDGPHAIEMPVADLPICL